MLAYRSRSLMDGTVGPGGPPINRPGGAQPAPLNPHGIPMPPGTTLVSG